MHRYSALALSALIALAATPAVAHPHPPAQPCDPPADTTGAQRPGADAATDTPTGAPGGGGGVTDETTATGTGADAGASGDTIEAFEDVDKDRPNQSGRQ